MKLLVLHNNLNPDQNKRSAVDSWRIARPIQELKKHTDWQIDERQSLIPSVGTMKSAKEFTPEELDKAFADVCQYDIVFSAYQSNPSLWTLLQVARDKAGTQYVMDVDDNMFAINPDNPVWMNVTDENVYMMQRMIANNPWITTTTDTLAKVFHDRRPDLPKNTVTVIPNFISDDYQEYSSDNGDKVVIGFFGGSTHYGDLHRTGVLEAVQKLMHEHKNLYFKSVGMIVDTYLPRARVIIGDAKKGDPWTQEVFPSLNLDIALGPLEDNLFNDGKSNIKWQESTRAGATFVCSNIGPYSTLPDKVAVKTANGSDAWYKALKPLIADASARQTYVNHARQHLLSTYRLEDNWQRYQTLFETIYKSSKRPVIQYS